MRSSKRRSKLSSPSVSSPAASGGSGPSAPVCAASATGCTGVCVGSPWKSPSFGSALPRTAPMPPVCMRSNALNASLIISSMAESCSEMASSKPSESTCNDTSRTLSLAAKLIAAMIRPTRRL